MFEVEGLPGPSLYSGERRGPQPGTPSPPAPPPGPGWSGPAAPPSDLNISYKWQCGVSTEWHLAVRRQDFITMPGDLREDTSELTGLQNCIDNVHHCTVHVHCTHKSSSSLSPSQRITLPSHLPLQALLLLLHTSVEDVRELRIKCRNLRDKNNVASIIVSQVRHLFIRYFFVIICSTNC